MTEKEPPAGLNRPEGEKSPLLENAIISIQLGLEDYESKDKRRVLSATRNLYSGVLLLCKEVLRRHSPPDSKDVLLKKTMGIAKNPDGSIRIVGAGKKTVGRIEIKKIFNQLQLDVDLSKLERLSEIRNEIEHLHTSSTLGVIREAIADAMPIIRSVIVNEIECDPNEFLGQEAWGILLEEARVFKEEEDACRASFQNVYWDSAPLEESMKKLRCPSCLSSLIKNESDQESPLDKLVLVCSKCGERLETETAFDNALRQLVESKVYATMANGRAPSLRDSPEFYEDEWDDSHPNLWDYTCSLCGIPLSFYDHQYGNGRHCYYCEHTMSKPD